MRLIKADHERRLAIPGVPGFVRRPVDIDQSKTDFAALRSLRIYSFDADVVIDGHAEEDEVFVVVLSGSIDMVIGWDEPKGTVGTYMLSAPDCEGGNAFVAYLPPHSNYQLTARTQSNIAYARATPKESGQPAIFHSTAGVAVSASTTLLEERSYASRLRLRVVRLDAKDDDMAVELMQQGDSGEALVHLQSSNAEQVATISEGDDVPLTMHAWQTVAISPGESPVLHLDRGATLTLMTVSAI